MRANQPVRLTITKVDNEGADVATVYGPIVVTLTDYTATIKHGHGLDTFYQIAFQRWHPQTSDIGSFGSTRDTIGSVPVGTPPPVPYQGVHKAVAGDTPWSVSLRHLRTGTRWREIANLNPTKITDARYNFPIPANTVLLLP